MACGLGAVVLLFMIIAQTAELRSTKANEQLQSEVNRLEQEQQQGQQNLVVLRNSLKKTEQELVVAQGLSSQIINTIERHQIELAEYQQHTIARQKHLNALKADVKSTEQELKRLAGSRIGVQQQGEATRTFLGQGDRQYLTGLKVGGKRVLILVDTSASMLDERIVNIIRRRNLPDAQKITAPKWQRAIRTVDWLTAQIPITSHFQIYSFNRKATPILEDTEGEWLKASADKLNQAVARLRHIIPQGGTSLYHALAVLGRLKPSPDNVYLLTDGLPTQGKSVPVKGTVSAQQRLRLFNQAIEKLSPRTPVNTILFPLEGDPQAASAYWRLAIITQGAFLSPSMDWP